MNAATNQSFPLFGPGELPGRPSTGGIPEQHTQRGTEQQLLPGFEAAPEPPRSRPQPSEAQRHLRAARWLSRKMRDLSRKERAPAGHAICRHLIAALDSEMNSNTNETTA